MCGIAGYKCFGNERPTKDELESLLLGIMSRGKDATGVAWIEKERLQVVKAPITAGKFIKSKEWKKVPIAKTMIMHARAATQGKPEENMNNHPVFNKDGMALTHNGMISNDKTLSVSKKYKMDAEVDSEIILKLVENGWWSNIKNLNELSGGFACAMIWERKPDELLLFRHSNPIVVHMDKKRDILFWASTKAILLDALVKYHRGFQTGGLFTYELQDDVALLINGEGIVNLKEIKPKPKYMADYKDWKDWGYGGQGKWDEKSPVGFTNKINKEVDIFQDAYCDYCNSGAELMLCGNDLICRECRNELFNEGFYACPVCMGAIEGDYIIEDICPHCQNYINPKDLIEMEEV